MSELLAGVALPAVSAIVEQRIGEGNGEPAMVYRLVIDGGHAQVVPAVADRTTQDPQAAGPSTVPAVVEDTSVVVMSQSRQTAEAVRRGDLAALTALQSGLITVTGDVRVLIAASEALALVNAALGEALADEPSRPGEPGESDERGGHGEASGPSRTTE